LGTICAAKNKESEQASRRKDTSKHDDPPGRYIPSAMNVSVGSRPGKFG
jgi:hypothetical protein